MSTVKVEHNSNAAQLGSTNISHLVSEVKKKVQEFSNKNQNNTVSYGKLVFTYANGCDKCLYFFAYLSCILTGVIMPSFVIIFDALIDSFGETNAEAEDILEDMEFIGKIFIAIGVGVWFLSYLYFSLLAIASERIIFKTRVAYFKAILS